MQLRTHPKMKWEGFSNWPPAWGGSYGRGDIFPIGEEGVLTDVEMAEADNTMPHHLTLMIEHRGNTSSGVLCCDDDEEVILYLDTGIFPPRSLTASWGRGERCPGGW